MPPEVFPFGTSGGATFGVLGLAGTAEVGGTREWGLGGGAGCFSLDTGGVAGEARATTYTSNHTHKSSRARPKA